MVTHLASSAECQSGFRLVGDATARSGFAAAAAAAAALLPPAPFAASPGFL